MHTFTWIADQFGVIVFGNICALIHWHDNRHKIILTLWESNFGKFCADSQGLQRKTELEEIFHLLRIPRENGGLLRYLQMFDYKGSCADFSLEKNCFDVKGWGHRWEKRRGESYLNEKHEIIQMNNFEKQIQIYKVEKVFWS